MFFTMALQGVPAYRVTFLAHTRHLRGSLVLQGEHLVGDINRPPLGENFPNYERAPFPYILSTLPYPIPVCKHQQTGLRGYCIA
jgi:hypothetical protein